VPVLFGKILVALLFGCVFIALTLLL